MDRKQIKTPHRAAQTAIPTSYIRSLIVQPENAGGQVESAVVAVEKMGGGTE